MQTIKLKELIRLPLKKKLKHKRMKCDEEAKKSLCLGTFFFSLPHVILTSYDHRRPYLCSQGDVLQ